MKRIARRRLAGGTPLDEDEVADLARTWLARHGPVDGDAPRPLPLGSANPLLRGEASRRVVLLTALADSVNLNALAPGQPRRPDGRLEPKRVGRIGAVQEDRGAPTRLPFGAHR